MLNNIFNQMIKLSGKRTGLIMFAIVLGVLSGLSAQDTKGLSLDSCHAMALRNYPLIKQYGLIELSAEYNLKNAGKAYLPQLVSCHSSNVG